MTRIALMKSNCTIALERCIQSFQILISTHKDNVDMQDFIEVMRKGLECCVDCLDACESTQVDRGVKMHKCVEACDIGIVECLKYNLEESTNCIEACQHCIEEFANILA